jgi:hypothetical protein
MIIPLKIEASFYDANSSNPLTKNFTVYINNSDDTDTNNLGLVQDAYAEDIQEKVFVYLTRKGYDVEDLEYEIYLFED